MKFNPIMPLNLRSNTVISVTPPKGINCFELMSFLRERCGIYISGGLDEWKYKIIRIGNMGFITIRELSLLINAIYSALKEKNLKIDLYDAIDPVLSLT